MLRSVLRSALIVGICSTLFSATQVANAALILNYQFESVDGTAPSQTTPDSSETFPGSGIPNYVSASPTVNAMLGWSSNIPGTNYPNQLAGPVANVAYQSLNPNNYMNFINGVSSSGTQNNYTQIKTVNASTGALGTALDSFSFAVWVNPSSTTGDRYLMGKQGASGQRGWQAVSTNGTTGLDISYFSDAAGTVSRDLHLPDGTLPLNTWTHVAFAFSGAVETFPGSGIFTGGSENIYINGVDTAFTTTGSTGPIPQKFNGSNTMDLKVGHRGATGSSIRGWMGGLDDVRFYTNTLDQAGVSALLVPVPEPSTYAIAAMGLVGFVMMRRRK